jgi:hypothetical protein
VLILLNDDHLIFEPFIKELIIKAVKPTDHSPPYGSWKDIRCIINHMKHVYDESRLVKHWVFQFLVKILAEQLLADAAKLPANLAKLPADLANPSADLATSSGSSGGTEISLAGKWAPREKSARFGWQSKHIAAACDLTQKDYRKMLSALNRRLKTTQIFQCERRWKDIDFKQTVTSRTLFLQRNAFSTAPPSNIDRAACCENYSNYLASPSTFKSTHVEVGELVREAYDGLHVDAINAHWIETLRLVRPFGRVVPFVDTSAAVAGDDRYPLYSAIGIGLQIAEKSLFGRRLMTFGGVVRWVNLDGATTLTDMVKRVECDELDANFEEVIAVFLKGINETGEDIKLYTIVVISDMAFQETPLHDNLKAQFEKANVTMPHIVYWKVRPSLHSVVEITDKNVSLISGGRPSLLNRLTNSRRHRTKGNTPWNKLVDMMCMPRYSWVWCVV